jgi:hypothetical protein
METKTITLSTGTITVKNVEAQHLSIGDKLASGGVVTHRPSVGIKTPSGKVELGVNGFLKVWNKRTLITIIID